MPAILSYKVRYAQLNTGISSSSGSHHPTALQQISNDSPVRMGSTAEEVSAPTMPQRTQSKQFIIK